MFDQKLFIPFYTYIICEYLGTQAPAQLFLPGQAFSKLPNEFSEPGRSTVVVVLRNRWGPNLVGHAPDPTDLRSVRVRSLRS